MIQGVNITLLSNPVEGDRISYTGSVGGVFLLYNNGLDYVDFEFTNNDYEILSNPLHSVKIGATISESANNLKAFFENNGYFFSSASVTYQALISEFPSIIASIEYPGEIVFTVNSYTSNISIIYFNDSGNNTNSLKYFLEYTNIENDNYRLEIYQKNYSGLIKEINGTVSIEKNEVKDHLDPIRGTGLNISLEANENLTFEDLYSESEIDFSVKFYRKGVLIFLGFLKPDGVFQSFVDDIWYVNIQCVDGLGFLDDLAFIKENGANFSGKQTIFDIVKGCLDRTGLKLEIQTSVNIYYIGLVYTENTDIFKNAYIDSDRYIKSDDNTTMGCKEVLISVLSVFNAVLTQNNGSWFIYRPNDIYNNYHQQFKRYDVNGGYLGLFGYNLKTLLGSQSTGFYPHHCSANQRIEIKGAVSAFRLGYKYGFVSSVLKNGNLKHEQGTLNYDGWTVNSFIPNRGTGKIIIDPLSENGISFEAASPTLPGGSFPYIEKGALTSDLSEFFLKDYTFDFKTKIISYGYSIKTEFTVFLFPDDSSDEYTMNQDGSWTLVDASFVLRNADARPNETGELVDNIFERSFTISSQPIPKDGRIIVTMSVPVKEYFGDPNPVILAEVKSIEIINTFQGNNVVGEFHTVNRLQRVSSIVKENKSVSNGDNSNKVYSGAIYKNNQTDLTSFWTRQGFNESKPLLRISAEDNLRINQIPIKLFSGDFYGYASYLSAYEISGLNGKFMPIAWTFDTFINVGSLKLLQLFSQEIQNITYKKTYDYGETVKPTITS